LFPAWFHALAILALLLGLLCCAIVLNSVLRHPQRMAIMNVVWPVTALFGTVVVMWGYFRYGRLKSGDAGKQANRAAQPFSVMVGKGALHCGSGCMIGDVIAEWLAFLAPSVAIWLGWQSLFAEKIFAVWILDFAFAFLLGIVFQYFAIVPMRKLSPGQGIVAALKADTLSLVAWQVGMYGLMAIVQFWLYPAWFGDKAGVDTPEFWFAMQIAMIAGFVTAYPVNWWLIRAGLKEKM
jgi:hypothetical protein